MTPSEKLGRQLRRAIDRLEDLLERAIDLNDEVEERNRKLEEKYALRKEVEAATDRTLLDKGEKLLGEAWNDKLHATNPAKTGIDVEAILKEYEGLDAEQIDAIQMAELREDMGIPFPPQNGKYPFES